MAIDLHQSTAHQAWQIGGMDTAAPPPKSAMWNLPGVRYPLVLLGLFVVVWILLGLAPRYRADWLLENLLVFIAIPVLVLRYRVLRFSDAAYTCLFVFFVLHQIGAHYTYAQVPYDLWAERLTGHRVSDVLGLSRNHYDRLVHFLYGLLVTPAAIELLDIRAPQTRAWRWWLPWFFVVSHATIFELLEALAAVVFGGELGQAYLGTQGDVWDSHKDSALAALGAGIAVLVCRTCRFPGTSATTEHREGTRADGHAGKRPAPGRIAEIRDVLDPSSFAGRSLDVGRQRLPAHGPGELPVCRS